MQSYLPGPSTYQLSGGAGIKCRAARERGQDIISLKVGAAVWCTCGIRLVLSARGVVHVVVQHTPQPASSLSSTGRCWHSEFSAQPICQGACCVSKSNMKCHGCR